MLRGYIVDDAIYASWLLKKTLITPQTGQNHTVIHDGLQCHHTKTYKHYFLVDLDLIKTT